MRRATAADGGDWVCGDAGCANVNFARRPTCNRCGRRKPRQAASPAAGAEIGKSAADKSRGLFSADDWQCGKCANVNWARRQTCNVCNAPRFGEVEARTGYGGGYNERGIVEYRLRKDSDDDDYDEFGRVKKRKARDREREKDRDVKKNSASNSHKGDNQSSKKLYDDEDEESGEEGDLSKYDLWGSEEENENKHEKEKEASSPSPKESTIDAEPKKGKEPSKSPIPPATESKRQLDRSRSASSKRSSSSSSSSTTSSGKPPRNRYDDFILNSEHSRAGSRDDSSSARSRSPVYDRSRRRSRSRDKKDKSGRADRDRKSRDNRDSNKSRGRNRDRDRDRHHYGGNRSKPGSGYTRGRAR